MNEQLIEQVTRLVVEKLKQSSTKAVPQSTEMPVKLYQTEASTSTIKEERTVSSPTGEVTFHPMSEKRRPERVQSEQRELNTQIEQPVEQAEWEDFRKKTPARVAVGRAGSRPKTSTWLKFRYDHAAAVDAVYGEVPEDMLQRLDLFEVTTKVVDKEEYIRRPDLGRRLSDDAKETIKAKCQMRPTVQIVASNGLSAKAVEENLEDVYLSLEQSLKNANIGIGTTFYVDQGRVALMDDIGELLEPDVVIMLIGERPGLVSAESLSAYLCYKPRIGTIEADRMVISNIHKGGIPPVEAGAYLGTVIQKVLKYEASGVSLVNKEG